MIFLLSLKVLILNSKPCCLKCKPMKFYKTFPFLNDPPAIKVLSTVVFLFFCALGPFALTAQELPPRSVLVVGQYSCPACQQALPKLAYYAPQMAGPRIFRTLLFLGQPSTGLQPISHSCNPPAQTLGRSTDKKIGYLRHPLLLLYQ